MNLRKARKWLSLCLAAMLAVSPMVVHAQSPYSDVPPDHWAYDAIVKLADAGIIKGFADGEFKGGVSLTRFEMANIVARSLDYMIENVERMNRSQAIILSDLLEDLVREFEKELRTLSVDLRSAKEEIEAIKRNQNRWSVNTTASITGTFRTVTGDGTAYEDPFADELTVVSDEESVSPEIEVAVSGKTGAYDVEMSLKASGSWNQVTSTLERDLKDFQLKVSSDKVNVRAGTIDAWDYASYLLSDDEDKLLGIEVEGHGNVLFNDSLKAMYASYRDGVMPSADDKSVLALKLSHQIGDLTFDGVAGYEFDGDPATEDNRVLGLHGRYEKDALKLSVGYAVDADRDSYASFGVGYDFSDIARVSLSYNDVSDQFDPIRADADLVESGQTVDVRIEFDPTSNTTLYAEYEKNLLDENASSYEVGADIVYEIIDGLSAGVNVNFDGNEVGYSAELSYTGHEIFAATLGVGRDDGVMTTKVALDGKMQFGQLDAGASVSMETKGEDRFTKFGGSLAYNLNDATKLVFDYTKADYSASDPADSYGYSELVVGIVAQF